ncbi:MAG: hypothetical protein Q7U54_13480, partial [Bacteroidales bacterium]|nr:hypothetical protein [Bacteroidales bacterium]
LMVAKHYYNNHYLFPALSIMGLVFVFIYLWAESFSKNKNNGIMKFAPPSIAVVFLVLALINKPYLTLSYEGYRQSNKSTDETMARIERDYPGYVKTYYYPGSFNQYAQLRWGNVYAKQFHTDMLMKLFPEGLFYDVRDNSFKFWETTISPEEFLKKYGSHILLVGGPINDNDLKLVENRGLKLKKLFEGRVQVVYEVDTTQSAFFRNIACERTVARVLKTDFETLSIDKQWIVINGYPFSKTSALSNEHPRSGKFSFSMPEKDTYAMESELKDIVPGEQFEVSIWRYGGDKDALLVASAANADLFYKCSTSTGEKDIKGWNKISLIFRIPSGFKENKIKLYLWNHGNKPVWFDDFELTQKK